MADVLIAEIFQDSEFLTCPPYLFIIVRDSVLVAPCYNHEIMITNEYIYSVDQYIREHECDVMRMHISSPSPQ